MSPDREIRVPNELDRHPELQYGIRLFEKIFRDPTPFIELGYSEAQRDLAYRTVQNMQGVGQVRSSPFLQVSFGNEKEDESVVIAALRCGGYSLDAFYDWTREIIQKSTTPEAAIESTLMIDLDRMVDALFSDDTFLVGRFRVIPAESAKGSLETVVKCIYEGSEGTMVTYDAFYIDEEERSDLVVLSDYNDRVDNVSEPQVTDEIWRKLSVVELDGREWIPYGRLPLSSLPNSVVE